ncbi:multicopper oxidase [Stipitochalara longipes BDJ]|nr:multicopper oxidase [Stipitochalara longipes BDJ]
MHLILGIFLVQVITAATITFNWSITWVEAAPDGFQRPVIGINGQWPCPTIEAKLGDTIVVNVWNLLGNETTGLHFHGQSQTGTNTMDGPIGVNQCAIPPGAWFTYSFTANPAGTYWYHSHAKGQYPDGLRGPMIIHDPNDPYLGKYSDELTLTVSDWFWAQMPTMLKWYLSAANSDGVEPAPNSTLLNDGQNIRLAITPGKTYRLRIINTSAMGSNFISFQGHDLTVIAVDGVNVEATTTSSIYISAAQRMDVLLTAKPTAQQNYFFVSSLDQDMYGGDFDISNPTAYGYLVYNSKLSLPPVSVPDFDPIDDFTLVPLDKISILAPVGQTITINMVFDDDDYGINRATINNQTYVPPIVPSLYTALSAPASDVMNKLIYGIGSNPFVVSYGEIVEVVINNFDTGSHPWHMHGHQFQVVYHGDENTTMWDETQELSQTPVRRDVMMVNTNSSTVWRFKANNPGVFLIHCHIDFHVEAGLTATLFEAPNLLQGKLNIPSDHLKACQLDNTPTVGNAAGNKNNFLDLTGQPTKPPEVDSGSVV